MQIKALNHWEY